MRNRPNPLLCELHAHTTWSDGELALPELVDLYGVHGFDVLCVTDHVVRADDPCAPFPTVREENFGCYLQAVEREADRARREYDLLVIPGVELTYNHEDCDLAAHAVALGLRKFVPVEHGLERALLEARDAWAAVIAAHPHSTANVESVASRTTRRFWRERNLAALAHRFELFNQNNLYGWVAQAGHPAVASGDFHRREHLSTWKTLLPCRKEESAVVRYLRSPRPAYLLPPASLTTAQTRAA